MPIAAVAIAIAEIADARGDADAARLLGSTLWQLRQCAGDANLFDELRVGAAEEHMALLRDDG